MTVLQEYDLEINPTKIFKGQYLILLVSKSNDPKKELQWKHEEDVSEDTLNVISAPSS